MDYLTIPAFTATVSTGAGISQRGGGSRGCSCSQNDQSWSLTVEDWFTSVVLISDTAVWRQGNQEVGITPDFPLRFIVSFVCTYVRLCVCMQKPEEGIGASWPGCWEPNSSLLQEQQIFLTVEPSPQPSYLLIDYRLLPLHPPSVESQRRADHSAWYSIKARRNRWPAKSRFSRCPTPVSSAFC